jgi:hypothetical protein
VAIHQSASISIDLCAWRGNKYILGNLASLSLGLLANAFRILALPPSRISGRCAVYAMQGDIRGEHVEEMKMVVMRDPVRVSRHLLGVWFDSEDGLCFLQARRLQGLPPPEDRPWQTRGTQSEIYL